MKNLNWKNNFSILYCWFYPYLSAKPQNTIYKIREYLRIGCEGYISLEADGKWDLFLTPEVWSTLINEWSELGLHNYRLASANKSLHSLFQAPYPQWALAGLSEEHKWQFFPWGNWKLNYLALVILCEILKSWRTHAAVSFPQGDTNDLERDWCLLGEMSVVIGWALGDEIVGTKIFG